MKTVLSDLKNAKVLVMGLGAHGGGAATARYCAESDAHVTVTDLRSEDDLSGSLELLNDLEIRYVLGTHREEDFRDADLVIKNPAVPRTSRFLRHAGHVETDISLFLDGHRGPVYAVTGTKGKSTTATALHHILHADDQCVRLGGNITVSPLTFCRDLAGDEPVVLELSSFQLGDLLLTPAGLAGHLPAFEISIITNILRDHQDYYSSMDDYARDKTVIFQGQRASDWVLLSDGDEYSRAFRPPHPDHTHRVRANDARGVLPDTLAVPGEHQRGNLLFAATAAVLAGREPDRVRELAGTFPGVPHRLEFTGERDGIHFYNDSAATIAEAAWAAVNAFDRPVHLIAGGSDKGLPLDLFGGIARTAASIHLLAGTATDRIVRVLANADQSYTGPHEALDAALATAITRARPGDVILLSPGCASFGMFRNEFDRGDRFRQAVARLPG